MSRRMRWCVTPSVVAAGYCWPAETDTEMRLSAEARARIKEAATFPEADTDGLLALVPVLGERPLADRLRTYCAAAWSDAWQASTEAALIAAACERAKDKPPKQLTLEAWLRTHSARQHAKLFHDRPFLWWITDGRADGFTLVAHYHRLTRANLERLAWTVLGDWITRLGDDPRAETARVLQAKLARILEGEKPFDIFVRWKPLEKQPLGWDPDLDDGVRLNIRPFSEAGVLAHVPNVKYTVDRGKDVPSAPWFKVFGGERRNDHHTTLAEKHAACAKAANEHASRSPHRGIARLPQIRVRGGSAAGGDPLVRRQQRVPVDHALAARPTAESADFRSLRVLRGKQDEKTYCLTGECSPDVERCLTARVPVASLISRPSHSSPSQF